MCYVYILNLSNGDRYTGFTGDLRRRIGEHRAGRVKSTEHRRPLELIHYAAYLLESEPNRRSQIKVHDPFPGSQYFTESYCDHSTLHLSIAKATSEANDNFCRK